ncbi:alpha/beta fold hydrolase [Devosia sp.]|uniref:alpha/beta fold hydrolase n=1 Tax=Devosia sp. TaxID=1871048 RepID=UPI002EEB55E1
MPMAKINGGEIYYKVEGSGPPLVQVPGAATGIQGYMRITPYLREHFTVLDFDPRGYGDSSRSESGYGFELWSRDLAALIDHVGFDKFMFHGASMGSTFALDFTANNPDRVQAMVLSGCTAKNDITSRAQFRAWKALAQAYGIGSPELSGLMATHSLTRKLLDSPEMGETFIANLGKQLKKTVTLEAYVAACDYLINVDVTDRLARIETPTLIMVGDEDVLTPAVQGPTGAGAKQIFDALTRVKLKEYVVLEGSAHSNMRDVPDVAAAAIIAFAKKVLG